MVGGYVNRYQGPAQIQLPVPGGSLVRQPDVLGPHAFQRYEPDRLKVHALVNRKKRPGPEVSKAWFLTMFKATYPVLNVLCPSSSNSNNAKAVAGGTRPRTMPHGVSG